MINRILCRLFGHRFKVWDYYDTDVYQYRHCSRCKLKQVFPRNGVTIIEESYSKD